MPTWIDFVLAYSLAFGLQNKVPFLDGKHAFLDALLKCAYCTGFHTGWMVWLVSWAVSGKLPVDGGPVAIMASVLTWAFSSAAVCYVLDTSVMWFEAHMPTQE